MQLSRLLALVVAASVVTAATGAEEAPAKNIVVHVQQRAHVPHPHQQQKGAYVVHLQQRAQGHTKDEVPVEVNNDDDDDRGWKSPVVDPIPHHKHVEVEDTYERVEPQADGKHEAQVRRRHQCRNGKCEPGEDDGTEFDWETFNEDYGFTVVGEESADGSDDDGNAPAHPRVHHKGAPAPKEADEDLYTLGDNLESVPQYYDQDATATELERVSRAVANELAATAISVGTEETETVLIASSIAGLAAIAVGMMVAVFLRRRVSSFDDETMLSELPEPQSVSARRQREAAATSLTDEPASTSIDLAGEEDAVELAADEEGSFSITIVRGDGDADADGDVVV